jgi:hypothetical protein
VELICASRAGTTSPDATTVPLPELGPAAASGAVATGVGRGVGVAARPQPANVTANNTSNPITPYRLDIILHLPSISYLRFATGPFREKPGFSLFEQEDRYFWGLLRRERVFHQPKNPVSDPYLEKYPVLKSTSVAAQPV